MYVTNADIIAWVGNERAYQLTTDTGTTPDTALIDDKIEEAEGEVNSAVAMRTSLTPTEADHPTSFYMLRGWVTAIVVYKLALRRPNMPEDWKSEYEIVMAALERLRKGQIEMPDVDLSGQQAEWNSKPQDADRDYMV